MMAYLSKVSLIKKLTWLYISTAVAVSSLAIGGQILTQRSLQAQSEDGRVINVAGRQRMLSQKIAKTAHTLSPTRSSSEANEAVIEELSTALKQFELAHQGLTSGSAELGLSRSNSAAVSELFAELEPDYQRLTKAAASMLNAASAADFEQRFSPETLASIDVGERQFLPEMNAIVVQYEQEAIANLNRLATIQRVLLVLTLLALVPVSLPLAQVIRRVKAAIATMQKSGVQVVSSSFQISASGKQLEAMVAEQAAASTQITASSREIATTARSLSQNVEAVMQSAVQTQQMAESGSQDLAAMAAIIDQMAQMTQAMALKLGTINDRASAIDQVVFAMTKVADQTNLLSLNAAIEAEKAGEYGLGFAVVAREIRRLSDQTSVAALDIDALVKEMQAAVAVGSAEVGRFSQQVNEGTDSAKKITQQAGVMSAQMQALLPSLAAVNQGIASQSSSASQIQDAMEQLSGGTGQTVQALQEINGALEQLQDVATRLQQEQVMA